MPDHRSASTSLLLLALGLTLGCAAQPQASASASPSSAAGTAAGTGAAGAPARGRAASGNQGSSHRPPARTQRGVQAAQTEPEPSRTPFADAWVAAHNLHRARVSPAASPALPAVRWSEELAATAQAWANRCEFEHSSGDHGENLSARTYQASPAEVVEGWAAEGQHFDYANNRCAAGEVCGHYTQVVWRDSTQIGCALAECSGAGPFGGGPWVLWVCNYSPAGNWMGARPY